jgi:signal transduction histidine kinase
MIKQLFIVAFCLAMNRAGFCQDSLWREEYKEIQKLANDSNKVNRLNQLSGKLLYTDPVEASGITHEAIALAEKISYPLGLSVAYGSMANRLFYEMKLDSSKLYIDKAYSLVFKSNDPAFRNQAALLINRYAAIHQQKQNYDSAVQLYLESAVIFTGLKDESKLIYSYYNLAGIYNFLGDADKAIFYARETRRIAFGSGDREFIIRSLMAVGDAFVSREEYDSVFVNAQQGLALANTYKMIFAIGKFHSLIGIYYSRKRELYDSAVFHFTQALNAYQKINTRYDIAIVLQNMGNAYVKKKDYTKASLYLTDGLKLSQELRLDQVTHPILKDLVEAEEKLGRVNESLAYLKQYVEVNDSLQKRNNRKIVNELEAKYQSQRKETLLASQERIIKQKNLLNYVLSGCVASAILISFLLYRTYRQKQKLQQQKLNELEKEKQLMATEAVLRGEDQERSRIAKDLHDGLGGMLSGIKYSFQNIKGSLVMTPDNQLAFERSMDMLDSSIKEMRRVAHNMMPEALVKFGLDTALRDFCNDINQSGALKVIYQSFGLENTDIDQTIAITIYRVIQELIHNTIKHARAGSAIVQLTKNGDQLSVTVEDDGKGFDTALLEKTKGMGWNNIQNRINFLKGKIDVQSTPGKGVSVHIELSV